MSREPCPEETHLLRIHKLPAVLGCCVTQPTSSTSSLRNMILYCTYTAPQAPTLRRCRSCSTRTATQGTACSLQLGRAGTKRVPKFSLLSPSTLTCFSTIRCCLCSRALLAIKVHFTTHCRQNVTCAKPEVVRVSSVVVFVEVPMLSLLVEST